MDRKVVNVPRCDKVVLTSPGESSVLYFHFQHFKVFVACGNSLIPFPISTLVLFNKILEVDSSSPTGDTSLYCHSRVPIDACLGHRHERQAWALWRSAKSGRQCLVSVVLRDHTITHFALAHSAPSSYHDTHHGRGCWTILLTCRRSFICAIAGDWRSVSHKCMFGARMPINTAGL